MRKRAPLRERVLSAVGALAVSRPWWVISIAAILAFGSAALLPGMEIVSSRLSLIDDSGETKAALERYGGQGDLVVVVSAEDQVRGRGAADALAARLGALPEAALVWHRLDPEVLHGRELDHLDADAFEGLLRLARRDAPRTLNEVLAASLEGLGADDGTLTLDHLEGRGTQDTQHTHHDAGPSDAGAIRGLTKLLDRLGRPESREWAERAAGFDEAGYLSSRDGSTRYVFVTPRGSADRYEDIKGLVAAAREIGLAIEGQFPGTSVKLTGYPAFTVDEVVALRDGTLITGVLATLLVVALFVAGFRSRAGVIIAGAPLGVGMVLAFGMIASTVGHLNLLTQAAAPVFAGLGIDFAVHLVSAYERARTKTESHAAAVDEAMRGAGAGIVTGAVTTAGAFFALTLAGYDAVVELGWVAGTGLLLVMVSVLFLTPALWTLGERHGGEWARVKVREPMAATSFSTLTAKRPLLWVALGAALTVGAGLGVVHLGFEGDVEALMPEDAQSVVAAREMQEASVFSNERAIAEYRDLPTLRRAAAAMAALPSVGRVESAASFWPPNHVGRRQQVAAAQALNPRSERPALPSDDTASAEGQLRALANEAARSSRELARVGVDDISAALADLAAGALEGAARLSRPSTATDAVANFDAALDRDVARAQALLRRADPALPPLPLDALPAGLESRLVREGEGGPRYALHVHPSGRVLDGEQLGAFVAETRGVDADIQGYPMALHGFLARSKDGITKAFVGALLVVLLVLALDFRNLRDVALALTPVVLGAAWTVGLMGWLNIDANPANIAALPLVLGVGVDDGVHLVHHRRRSASTAASVRALWGALVLTSATTAASFGTLMFAAHRGMQSFGLVMVIGTAGCLVATLFVLPALMRLCYRG